MRRELELYIHIPFCMKKCEYCDFLSGPASAETIESYVYALISEIDAYKEFADAYLVTTIFFGGGTPSLLSGKQMGMILKRIHETFLIDEHAEITMEANPGTVTEANLKIYKQAGINRISFGVQSVNNEELKMLGRIHTFEEFLESFQLARKVGFQNINVDLISAIPKQTCESWKETLEKIVSLKPEHISAYSLIIEEGTPFAKLYGEGAMYEDLLPSEDEERKIYEMTEDILAKEGYHRYEISNYAKEGLECRHNLGYWERKEYLGLGLGASSLINEERFHNTEEMKKYLFNAHNPKELREDIEMLGKQEQMEEFVFLGLRKMNGIKEEEFEKNFGISIWDCYGEHISKMLEEGLLEREHKILRLTNRGIDISNYVFAEILFQE